MEREKGTFLSFRTNAWAAATVLFLALTAVSVRPLAALTVPVLVSLVLAWPRLRALRTGTFALLLGLCALALVPRWALRSSALSFLLGALTILAAETARAEGVGLPVARFLRSTRVQGWAALILSPPLGLVTVLSVDRELQHPGIPPAWRWSLLGLVFLMLVPLGRSGNLFRIVPVVLLVPVAFLNSVSTIPQTTPAEIAAAEHLYGATRGAIWCLILAVSLHEGWAKIRGERTLTVTERDDPIRVHSGAGIL